MPLFHHLFSRLLPRVLAAQKSQHGTRRLGRRRALTFQPRLEILEDRLVLSNIAWVNRGSATVDTDGFNAVFGTQAAAARNVVDAAIDLWERVITNFNQPFGGNTLNINILMNPLSDVGAFTNVNADPVTGLPASGSIQIFRGNDGSGGGYFIDPTPTDSAEFNATNLNAFVGAAATDTPAGNGRDLFSLVAHELVHILGIHPNPLLQFHRGGFNTDTGIVDNSPVGGGNGTYWVFQGPSVSYLMTSNNAGPFGQGFPVPFHSAAVGDAAFPITFDDQLFRGVDDILNSVQLVPGRRQLPSNAIALILHDAYGYDIVSPERFGTFHALFNSSDGNLLIRGGAGTSSDNIRLSREGGTLVVSVDLGDDVPGVVLGSSEAFVSRFAFNAIRSIDIQTGDGDDTVTLDFAGGDLIPEFGIRYDAGDGTDRLNAIANADFNFPTFRELEVVGSGPIDMTSAEGLMSVESASLTGGSSANIFNVSQWLLPAMINGAGGLDTIVADGFGNFELNDGFLNRLGRERLDLQEIERANLTGGTEEDNDFFVHGWTGLATLNGRGGFDEVFSTNESNFTLTNTTLTRSTGGTFSLRGINRVALNGGPAANTFTVNGWGAAVELRGVGGADVYAITLNNSNLGTYVVADSGESGFDELRVTGTAVADTLTIRRDAVLRGPQSVTYAGIERLRVNSVGAADAVTVESTSVPLTINTGTENDTVNVGYTQSIEIDSSTGQSRTIFNIPTSVTVDGSAGTADTLNINLPTILVSNSQLTSNQLTGNALGIGGLSYSNVDRLNLSYGASPDQITVLSTAAGVTTRINSGSGADTIRLGGTTVNNIRGPLTINGGANATGSTDTIILQENEPAGAFNTGVLGTPLSAGPGTGFLTGMGMRARVDFRNTERVRIIEGASNDTVSLQFSSPPAFSFNLSLDGGNDGIVFLGTDENDRIQIGRRVGPSGPEVIAEINGRMIVGGYEGGETIRVLAGAGNDQVTVDASVTTWRAELFGEGGNDHLVGGPLADLLDGGAGNDYLEGMNGDDELIGGPRQDLFDGGAGADLIRARDGAIDVIIADLADQLLDLDLGDLMIRRRPQSITKPV